MSRCWHWEGGRGSCRGAECDQNITAIPNSPENMPRSQDVSRVHTMFMVSDVKRIPRGPGVVSKLGAWPRTALCRCTLARSTVDTYWQPGCSIQSPYHSAPRPEVAVSTPSSSSIHYVLSNFLRNSLVLFMSFLYLCFFILSFLCLFTLIRYIPNLRFATCCRKLLGLLSSEGNVTSVIR